MNGFPSVLTERLVLREMAPSDAADVFAAGGDDEVMRFYDMDTFPSEREALEFIRRQRERFDQGVGTRWGMELKGARQIVGWCGFTPGLHRKAEVGYVLARRYWGQGLATEALRAVTEFAFANTDLNRLEAVTHPPNVASARVLEKCGFQPDGLIRQYGFWRGEFHDMILPGLLRSDITAAQKGIQT